MADLLGFFNRDFFKAKILLTSYFAKDNSEEYIENSPSLQRKLTAYLDNFMLSSENSSQENVSIFCNGVMNPVIRDCVQEIKENLDEPLDFDCVKVEVHLIVTPLISSGKKAPL